MMEFCRVGRKKGWVSVLTKKNQEGLMAEKVCGRRGRVRNDFTFLFYFIWAT